MKNKKNPPKNATPQSITHSNKKEKLFHFFRAASAFLTLSGIGVVPGADEGAVGARARGDDPGGGGVGGATAGNFTLGDVDETDAGDSVDRGDTFPRGETFPPEDVAAGEDESSSLSFRNRDRSPETSCRLSLDGRAGAFEPGDLGGGAGFAPRENNDFFALFSLSFAIRILRSSPRKALQICKNLVSMEKKRQTSRFLVT